MRRLESKNPPDRPLMSAETRTLKIAGKAQRRPVSERWRVSAVRENWMVVCAVVCELVSPVSTLFSPVLRLKTANFAGSGARVAANHLNYIVFCRAYRRLASFRTGEHPIHNRGNFPQNRGVMPRP